MNTMREQRRKNAASMSAPPLFEPETNEIPNAVTVTAAGHLPATIPTDVLAVIAAAAADPRVDPAKLEALLGLKERIDAREAERQFNEAFARMAPALPRIKKTGKITLGVGKGEIPYARWEDADKILRPILAAHGFSLRFPTKVRDGQTIMVCVLSHVGGHSETTEDTVVADTGPGRNATQAWGSGRTYKKRYLAFDILNIVTEGIDDDGRMADPLNDQEYSNVLNMVNELGFSDQTTRQFLKFAGAPSVEMIQRFRYEDVMSALHGKLSAKKREGK